MKISTFASFLLSMMLVLDVVYAAGAQIGVSATSMDLGTFERDSENIANFFLVTTSDESFKVSLDKEPETSDFFERRGFENRIYNYSEEEVVEWIEIFDTTVEMESAIEGESTVTIGGKKEINFLVNVPEDAEPGYHIFRIKPIPAFDTEVGGDIGAKIISLTTISFIFDVPGKAVREGIILDVEQGKLDGNVFITDTYFQNTGTVTMKAYVKQDLYKNGTLVASSRSSEKIVEPKEVKVLQTPFRNMGIGEGGYVVATTVDYKTGNATMDSGLTIIEPYYEIAEKKEREVNWLLIVAILIILVSILIYKIS